jgi:hypothetical protein
MKIWIWLLNAVTTALNITSLSLFKSRKKEDIQILQQQTVFNHPKKRKIKKQKQKLEREINQTS